MNDESPNQRCGGCWFFQKFHAEQNGNCLHDPPTPLPNGTSVRAKVRVNEYACSKFKAGHRPEFEKPQPASPAQAERDRRRALQSAGTARPVMATAPVNKL